MTNLTRWDPFRDMLSLRSQMDRLMDSFVQESGSELQPQSWGLPLDIVENADEYVVKASIPGMRPEDVEITFNNNTLTLCGETHSESEKEGERYHLRERRYGKFSRTIALPAKVNGDAIQANCDAGVLTLRLPKAEEMKPRRINVLSSRQPEMIEGKLGSNNN